MAHKEITMSDRTNSNGEFSSKEIENVDSPIYEANDIVRNGRLQKKSCNSDGENDQEKYEDLFEDDSPLLGDEDALWKMLCESTETIETLLEKKLEISHDIKKTEIAHSSDTLDWIVFA